MKNTIKIFSIILLGLATMLSSCQRESPYPQTETVAFVHLFRIAAPPLIISTTPLSSEVTVGLMKHRFGGDFVKVDVCVVFDRTTPTYKTGVLASFTPNQLSETDTVKLTYTLQELLDVAGQTALTSGGDFSIYYTVHMPNGKAYPMWNPIAQFVTSDYNSIPLEFLGAVRLSSNVQFNVGCGLILDEFLGDWLISHPWLGVFKVVATEDPDKAGSLVFIGTTASTEGDPPFSTPLKVTLDLSTLTYDMSELQTIWDNFYGYESGFSEGGDGNLLSCGGKTPETDIIGEVEWTIRFGGFSSRVFAASGGTILGVFGGSDGAVWFTKPVAP